jgi:hypothetical protein
MEFSFISWSQLLLAFLSFHIMESTAFVFSPIRTMAHVILLRSAVFSFIAWSLGNPSALCAGEIGSLAVSDVLRM